MRNDIYEYNVHVHNHYNDIHNTCVYYYIVHTPSIATPLIPDIFSSI